MTHAKSLSEKMVDLKKAGWNCAKMGIDEIHQLWNDWYNGVGEFCDSDEPYNFEGDTNF